MFFLKRKRPPVREDKWPLLYKFESNSQRTKTIVPMKNWRKVIQIMETPHGTLTG